MARVSCDNCDFAGDESQLNDIADYGALAYPR